jgi:hypothetical protein
MMQIANRDVFPTSATTKVFEPIKTLFEIPAIDEAFNRHEAAAVRAKRRYHRFGRIAIVLIAFSSIYTVAEAIIIPAYPLQPIVSAIAVFLAGFGILLQIYLIVTHQKEKWLLNRYAVERLRSAKFQAYHLGHIAEDADELERLSDQFAIRQVAQIENELNGGDSVFRAFQPVGAVSVVRTPKKPANADLARITKDAYCELRVQYQRRFAQSELTHFANRRRVFYSSQDMIYLSAAAFAFFALATKLFAGLDGSFASGWLDFLAVTLFIVGATVSILDNASIEEQSQTRFEQYVRDIERISADADQTNLLDLVYNMELLCLQELDTFCRAGERISYRL